MPHPYRLVDYGDARDLDIQVEAQSTSGEDAVDISGRMPTRRNVAFGAGLMCVLLFVACLPRTAFELRAFVAGTTELYPTCPTCMTGVRYPESEWICTTEKNEKMPKACWSAGCTKRSASKWCAQPLNSILDIVQRGTSKAFMWSCPQTGNNPYECKAAGESGCSLPTCELGISISQYDFNCSDSGKVQLQDKSCGTAGCVPQDAAGSGAQECYAPEGSYLMVTGSARPYRWSCEYTVGMSHSYMCPKPPAKTAACFLGTSLVDVLGHGMTQIRHLRVGDVVRVEHWSGKPDFEPIVDFLHTISKKEGVEVVVLKHAHGDISASSEHLVLVGEQDSKRRAWKPMEDVRVGDLLFDATGNPNVVDRIDKKTAAEGFFAPLTMSGTIAVNGVVASNYAGAMGVRLPHGAMHAAFFMLRTYRRFVPASKSIQSSTREYMNPLAAFLLHMAGPLVLPSTP